MDLQSRPKLVRFAKLRRRPECDERWLLSPERGLSLNESAFAILLLCDGLHSVGAITAELSTVHGVEREPVERDVRSLLEELERRGLLTWEAG